MFDIFSKILNVKELRHKLLVTLGLLAVFRVGIFIPTPGINVANATQFMEQLSGGALGGVMQMADMFTGGALSQMAIFGLGIMPYITASIIFQLLVAIVPSLSRIAREGATGRKRINQYVRVSTVGLCVVHSAMICSAMWGMNNEQSNFIVSSVGKFEFFFFAMLSLTAGTMFLMWLGEQIDEFGIGNGISLIIMVGILARLPVAVSKVWNNFGAGGDSSVGPGTIAVLLILFVGMTLAVVMMTLGTRRVPVMQSKAMRGRMMVGGQRQHIPLKVNQANVIPIIFAQAILQVVAMVANFLSPVYLGPLFAPNAFIYTLLYISMIIFFCYFYTAIQFNPNEMSDNLKQSGMYIPGIRPGLQTAKHIERIMTRVALAGGVFLAAVAIVPSVISSFMGVDYDISGMLGGTGLLIVVGVALDVVQRIESYLLMRNYEGFGMAGGRVRGRRG